MMNDLLDTRQAAEYLQLAPVTLETWRYKHVGPPWIRLEGRAIRYELKALREWVASQRVVTKPVTTVTESNQPSALDSDRG